MARLVLGGTMKGRGRCAREECTVTNKVRKTKEERKEEEEEEERILWKKRDEQVE